MTIDEFKEKHSNLRRLKDENGRDFLDVSVETLDVWSNDACRGYCICALKGAGMDNETINKIVGSLHGYFNDLTVDEAAEIFCRFINETWYW